MRTAAVAILALAAGGAAGYVIGRRTPPPSAKRIVREREEAPRVAASVEWRPVRAAEFVESPTREQTEESRPSLVRELRANPAALRRALEELRLSVGTEKAELLAVVLGEVRDPAVEALALDLARAGHLVGFDLLDRLDIENPETRRTIIEFIRTETRPEILGAAIYALHRGVPDPRERREAVEALLPAAANADPEVRRRAVIALGEWGAAEPALRALEDPSVDVRCGAAYVLGNAPGAADALAARVADEREDWAVREQAWKSLGRLVLDGRTHEVWCRFREKREALMEGNP